MKNTICRECGGNCKHSKGIMNYHDIRTNDISNEFTTVLEDCLKCEDCGHSFKLPQNIYLNRLREQYKQTQSFKHRKVAFRNHTMYYNAVRVFCLDTQLLSFNDIEAMEYEVDNKITN